MTTKAGRRSNGDGTLWRDPRGHWTATVMIGGRRIKRTGATRTEARQRMEQAKAASLGGLPVGPGNVTVKQYLELWVSQLPGTVAGRTEESYGHAVRFYLIPRIGNHRLTKLSPSHVVLLLADMEKEGYSANTRRIARSTLRRALRMAERDGLVARNVAALAPGPRMDKKPGRTLTPQESRIFLKATRGDRLEASWVTMLACGLRRSEMLGLAWEDLDLDVGTLTVRRSLVRVKGQLLLGDTKTPGSKRTLYLPAEVIEVLRHHKARQAAERLAAGESWRDSGLVITTASGTPFDPDNFRRKLSALTTRAGLGHWSTHELRHSAASLMLANQVGLKVVSETLGHSSIRLTADTYAHLLAPARRDAAEAMGRALWG